MKRMNIVFVLSVLLFLAATIQPHPQCRSFWRGSRRSRRSRRSTQGPLRARPPTQAPVSSCVRDQRDGCSNLGLGGWENTFTSSCDRHDMCYICVSICSLYLFKKLFSSSSSVQFGLLICTKF